jgi:hypothetical protein
MLAILRQCSACSLHSFGVLRIGMKRPHDARVPIGRSPRDGGACSGLLGSVAGGTCDGEGRTHHRSSKRPRSGPNQLQVGLMINAAAEGRSPELWAVPMEAELHDGRCNSPMRWDPQEVLG